jgi:hypothetical protein
MKFGLMIDIRHVKHPGINAIPQQDVIFKYYCCERPTEFVVQIPRAGAFISKLLRLHSQTEILTS